nr:DUF4124 domain-containing protein [uncultured Albidiferax sp.]
MKALWCVVALVACAPAWAINKCTGADGKVVFQDAACEGRGEKMVVRPASGNAPSATTAAVPAGNAVSAAPKKLSEAERMEGEIAESQRQRRKQEYELRTLPGAYAAVNQQRAACDKELRALQEKKSYANNNLAGATWETSISAEMTAIATRCDTRNRELRDDIETVRKECQALGGCK